MAHPVAVNATATGASTVLGKLVLCLQLDSEHELRGRDSLARRYFPGCPERIADTPTEAARRTPPGTSSHIGQK
jgi:hypothetical protein